MKSLPKSIKIGDKFSVFNWCDIHQHIVSVVRIGPDFVVCSNSRIYSRQTGYWEDEDIFSWEVEYIRKATGRELTRDRQEEARSTNQNQIQHALRYLSDKQIKEILSIIKGPLP